MSTYTDRHKRAHQRKQEMKKLNPDYKGRVKGERTQARNRRTEKYLLEIGFDHTKIHTGICCFIGCNTIKSQYNKDHCCVLHQKLIVSRGFFFIIERENYSKAEGRDI